MIVSIPCSLLSVDSRSDSHHLPLAEPADSTSFNVLISVLTHTSTSSVLGACCSSSLPSSSLQISLSQCRLPSGWSLFTTQGVMALYKLYVSVAGRKQLCIQDSIARAHFLALRAGALGRVNPSSSKTEDTAFSRRLYP